MTQPESSRPYMPGYGVEPRDRGTGLLPWSWAEVRLARAHDYWLATARPTGRPHLMPVWAVWHDGALWFSSSRASTKAVNLRADPRCSISTDDAREPVVVEGSAELVTDLDVLRSILEIENTKYETSYTMELFDPDVNANFRLRPSRAFGLSGDDFTGSPTRWRFA